MAHKQKVQIQGMHCKACTKIVADELLSIRGVKNATVSLKLGEAYITSTKEIKSKDIRDAIKKAGYKVGADNKLFFSHNLFDYLRFLIGIIVSAAVFFLFSQAGIDPSRFLSNNETSAPLIAIVLGLTAGFSTCMALIGGLVIAVGARHQKKYPDAKLWRSFEPHIAFNIGRILGFAVLGGFIGLLGSALTFSPLVLGALTALVGIFMLAIGLQLTGVFPRLTAFSLPPKLSEKLGIDKHKNAAYHPFRTALIGALTFFLPCGFTQAMQLFTVTTGSWQMGALSMGLFAVGTTPGLLLVGGLTSLIRGEKGKNILKIVGALIVALSFISISNGLNISGFRLDDLFSPVYQSPVVNQSDVKPGNELNATFIGGSLFKEKELEVKTGEKYILNVHAEANGAGCMSTVMIPNISSDPPQLLRKGETVKIEFAARKSGVYEIQCAMGAPFDLKIQAK
ncbi:MAG: sulfite exporter TauE/SafE family protein [Bifidobacteriaceae bacterium]|jgi:sulfite exporter TauE/SafE/copper chaperone CopZ|nr:sulfite exporter TauE/SafE family protein [Bifidobacteriaceae bacterium]